MPKKNSLTGRWVSMFPTDSDDYLVEYTIEERNGIYSVSGKDLQDGENMRVSHVRYVDGVLSFRTLMPSTNRTGLHRFRLLTRNRLQAEFTFTVHEELKRID